MKHYNYIFTLLLVGFATLTSCTQDDNIGYEGNPMQGFQVSVSDTGFKTNNATRATENNYSTIFTNGDAIGIFAVRNGEIVSNINNVKCTMQDGAWEMDTNIEYKESEFKKMSFYAYYPYNALFDSNTDFDKSKTLTDGDPFEGYVANWKIEADQNEANYTKYDLMTSVGKASGQRLKGEVSFVMQHRMALAVLQMPEVIYDFTNEDATIADYALPTKASSFKLNNTTAKPYEQEINSKTYYRFLVNPNKKFSIEGSYIAGKDEKTYDHTATLTSGQAKLYKVKNPEAIEHLLSVGDYLCADGSIVSKDAAAPENAIGVVYFVGNPQPSFTEPEKVTTAKDALLRNYPNAVHGLVMALDNTQENMVNMGSPNTPYSDFIQYDDILKELYLPCNTNKNLESCPGYAGYNNTAILLLANEAYPDRYVSAVSQINSYKAAVVLPENVTPWYLPSFYELVLMANNFDVLNKAVSQVGGTELEQFAEGGNSGLYWSSTERNGNTQWVHPMQGEPLAVRRDLRINGYFRMAFAF